MAVGLRRLGVSRDVNRGIKKLDDLPVRFDAIRNINGLLKSGSQGFCNRCFAVPPKTRMARPEFAAGPSFLIRSGGNTRCERAFCSRSMEIISFVIVCFWT